MTHDKSKLNKHLLEKVQELLTTFPDALEFVIHYKEYIHAIDDLIDSNDRPTPEEILAVFSKAAHVFSLPFWKSNAHMLFMVEQIINNEYADSVNWEKSEVKWKVSDANALRHTGINMFFAVILLTHGRDTLRDISLAFREQCHLLHTNESGEGV